MKFNNLKVTDLDKFFDVVNSCDGAVYLESPDMRLNLKSNLCQYVSLAKLCCADEKEISEIEVHAEKREDIDKLFKFMCGGIG